jgi:hypothetical protein
MSHSGKRVPLKTTGRASSLHTLLCQLETDLAFTFTGACNSQHSGSLKSLVIACATELKGKGYDDKLIHERVKQIVYRVASKEGPDIAERAVRTATIYLSQEAGVRVRGMRSDIGAVRPSTDLEPLAERLKEISKASGEPVYDLFRQLGLLLKAK